ncbi:MAG: hypothetical protein AAGA03_16520, partial [Planctomycetota bacterium]
FDVIPVPDPPDGIEVNVDPIPEHTLPGTVVGTIEIIDVDDFNLHSVEVADPRFELRDGQLILLGPIDYEIDSRLQIEILV